jgi:non-specific serine/threonine protein kinase
MDSGPNDLSIEGLEQIDQACQEFEIQFKQDLSTAEVAGFLSRIGEELRSELLVELIQLKADYQLKQGQWPDQQSYLKEFPNRADAVNDAFSKIAQTSQRRDAIVSALPDLGPRYRLGEVIGAGGMGKVFRARDLKLEREVAVKVLKKNDCLLDQRFEREIRSVAALIHPNIVSLFDFSEHRGVRFAVMELVLGQTLRQAIQQTPTGVAAEQVVSTAVGIARALSVAHRQGIMHRDIKPENVIITSDGQVKVLDFGLARAEYVSPDQSLTATSITPGTFPYMSPEQAANGELSCATDIFSLGTLLYEMLTGTNPFLGSNVGETTRNVIERQLPRLASESATASLGLPDLIARMLSKTAQQRPTAEQVVEHLTQSDFVSSRDFVAESAQTTISILGSPVPTNLPMRSANLIGRNNDMAFLAERLQTPSLTTLVGAGGTGKTSLAYQAARQNLSEFPGGVWVCELASLQPSGDVTQKLAAALDETEGNSSGIREIVSRLEGRRVMILLDNCEHVIDQAAELAEALLEQLPLLTVLATSRQPLDLVQEHICFLNGLEIEGTESDAAELFVRCASAKAGYSDAPGNRRVIEKIVSRLEGLPLLIELAAPKLKAMTLEELLHSLDDQLSMLQSRRKSADRQATVGQTIAWSFQLLDTQCQGLLMALSVFQATFSRSAAQAVADIPDATDVLTRLIDQSVVVRIRTQTSSRFRLLEPIRQFCQANLDKATARNLHERHARYFAGRAIQIGWETHGCKEIEAAADLNLEWADLRAAVNWGIQHEVPEIAIDSIVGLGATTTNHLRNEAYHWIRRSETAMPAAFETRPKGLAMIALGYWLEGKPELAQEYVSRSMAIRPTPDALVVSYSIHYAACRFAEAAEDFQLARKLGNEDHDLWARFAIFALDAIALAMIDPGDPRIDPLFEAADKRVRELNWPSGFAWQYHAHSMVEGLRGNSQRSQEFTIQAVAASRNCGNRWLEALSPLSQEGRAADGTSATDFLEAIEGFESVFNANMPVHLPLVARTLVLALIDAGFDDLAAKLVPVTDRLVGYQEPTPPLLPFGD